VIVEVPRIDASSYKTEVDRGDRIAVVFLLLALIVTSLSKMSLFYVGPVIFDEIKGEAVNTLQMPDLLQSASLLLAPLASKKTPKIENGLKVRTDFKRHFNQVP
jgi:hypothetical protein